MEEKRNAFKVIRIVCCTMLYALLITGIIASPFISKAWRLHYFDSSYHNKQTQLKNSLVLPDISYYHKDHLSPYQQSIYDKVEDCISQHCEFTIFRADITETEFHDIMDMAYSDHPETFWFENNYTYHTYPFGFYCLMPTYTYDLDQTLQLQDQLAARNNEILSSFPTDMNDYEKARTVFDYICDTVTYLPDSQDNQNLLSALLFQNSVCGGYAKASQYLLQQTGIEAMYVGGRTNEDTMHAWLIINLDGNYYHFDSTWGDVQTETQPHPDFLNRKYAYLATTDTLIKQSRTITIYDHNLPICDSIEDIYYVQNQLYFDTAEQAEAHFYTAFNQENYLFTAQFSNDDAYQAFIDTQSTTNSYWQAVSENLQPGAYMVYHQNMDDMKVVTYWLEAE